MPLTTIPSRTDGSLGRAKATHPTKVGLAVDLDYDHTAAEHESIKTAIIAVCEQAGLADGSTVGSMTARIGDAEADIAAIDARVTSVEGAVTPTAIVDADFAGTAPGILTRTGAAAYSTLRTNSSAGAPTVDDDAADGYAPGSLWTQPHAEIPGRSRLHLLASSETGAALWIALDGPATIAPPEVGRSSLAGYGTRTAREDHTHDAGRRVVNAVSSTPLTLTAAHEILLVDTASAVIVIDLPSLSTPRDYMIRKTNTGANKITLNPPTGVVVEYGTAGADFDLPGSTGANRPWWYLVFDGTGWHVR